MPIPENDREVNQHLRNLDFIGEAARHNMIGLYIALPTFPIARDWQEDDRGNVLLVAAGANHPDRFPGAAEALAQCDGVFIIDEPHPPGLLCIASIATQDGNIGLIECAPAATAGWRALCEAEGLPLILGDDGELMWMDSPSGGGAA